MLMLHRRLKRLEEEMMPASDPDLPKAIILQFVDGDKRIVEEKVIQFAEVHPLNRRPSHFTRRGRR